MNPSNPFNPAQHVTTLRQSHRTVTSLLPVLTATLTVAGAVIAALEARAPQSAPAGQGAQGERPAGAQGTAAGRSARSRVSARRYLATLVGRMLLVTLGIALVLALVYVASVSGQVGQAILLTALILLSLYLVEKVARRA